QNEKGEKTAIIHAQKAFTAPRPHEYFLEEVDSEFFDDDGSATTIVADAGHYNLPAKQLRLESNIVIVDTAANYTMKTDVLIYDGRRRTILCPEPTRLEGNGITIAGSSLQHNMNTGIYIVGGRVRSTIEGYSAGSGSIEHPQ
ncbi:MAG TPA: LPS export ABC transporter periplasmic protein LptC, partial [Desulfopila sp.]|nr:LPS export ABC transporter periplasmic protein LptC [Desulfopila sp.]